MLTVKLYMLSQKTSHKQKQRDGNDRRHVTGSDVIKMAEWMLWWETGSKAVKRRRSNESGNSTKPLNA